MRFARGLVALAVVILSVPMTLPPTAQAGDAEFVLEMKQILFAPDVLAVSPGDTVTIRVFNNDSAVGHTFDLDEFGAHLGTVLEPILPGESPNVTFVANRAGEFWFYCNIPGHAQELAGGRWSGMAGLLRVGEPEPPPDATPLLVGSVILVVALAVVLYAVSRRRKK